MLLSIILLNICAFGASSSLYLPSGSSTASSRGDSGNSYATTTVHPVVQNLPLTGQTLIRTLERALQIEKGLKSGKRDRRGPSCDAEARNLLRFLTQDPEYAQTSSESSQDTSPVKKSHQIDAEREFCLPSTSFGSGRRTSLETMTKITQYAAKGLSEASIRAKYPWYNRKYLADFKKCVAEGGSHSLKREQIENHVREQVDNLIRNHLPVKGYMLRAFGRRYARQINAPWFVASSSWCDSMKKKIRISSRKVTKTVSTRQIAKKEDIAKTKKKFLEDFARLRRFFYRRAIWNIDQTGVEYEQSNKRTLAYTGSRDVYLRVESLAKTTHSFTAQPLLSRDGRLIGKLALCMQETSGNFGPRVQPSVESQERQYGNIRVYASKSGKMSSELMQQWLVEVVEDAIENEPDPLDEYVEDAENYPMDSEDEECVEKIVDVTREQCRDGTWMGTFFGVFDDGCLELKKRKAFAKCHRPNVVLVSDSWTGQTSFKMKLATRLSGAKPLTVPAHLTGELQPLDVGFFLQLKKFIRRIAEEALVQSRTSEISDRAGIINLMSLIHNQFQSPAYHDLWTYSWRNTDPSFSEDEIAMVPPPTAMQIQFGYDPADSCTYQDCHEEVIMRCSHCGEPICLTHFLNRTHFHRVERERNAIDLNFDFNEVNREILDSDMESDEELVLLDEHPRSYEPTTTTTTENPLYQVIFGSCDCY